MKTEEHVNYDKERLRAISLVEVASLFGKVKRTGSTYKTLCPWHDDHNPSLSIYMKNNLWKCHCFSCGKGGDVIEYVRAAQQTDFLGACEWLSRQYGIYASSSKPYVPPRKKKPSIPEAEKPLDYIPMEKLDELVSVENSLCKCLMQWYRPEAVENVVEEYRIGHYTMYGRDDISVFPNIDIEGRLCNLKVQCYETDIESQRFSRSIKGRSYMLAAIWQREGKLPVEGNYKAQCLFGEHLLREYPAQTVALVESPKNAIVGALEMPEMLWVAVGNKSMLSPKYLKALRSREVIVIPDCDAIDEWTMKIAKMKGMANFVVSDFCRRMAPEGQTKYDIADYYIDERKREISEQIGEKSGCF